MNKKGLIIFIVGVIIIILVILFLLKGCTPRTKTDNTATLPPVDTSDGTELVLDDSLDITKYRDPFINANTDFTCETIANPEMTKDEMLMKSKLDEAYKKYGFPIEDTNTMIQILNKYENDTEVIDIIRTKVKGCQKTTPSV